MIWPGFDRTLTAHSIYGLSVGRVGDTMVVKRGCRIYPVFWRLFLANFIVIAGSQCLAWGQQNARSKELLHAFEQGTPFSFVYGGKPAASFLSSWKKSETVHPLADGRTLRTITYQDPVTHLEVSREITLFPNANAMESMLTLHNAGTQDTPILENILPLDAEIALPAADAVTFHHVHGSVGSLGDYVPVDKRLDASTPVEIAHYIFENGQHKDTFLPFFNAQWASGGLIGAIGWTGQWMVKADRSPRGLELKSGQQMTNLTLHPGEKIRTPRVLQA